MSREWSRDFLCLVGFRREQSRIEQEITCMDRKIIHEQNKV